MMQKFFAVRSNSIGTTLLMASTMILASCAHKAVQNSPVDGLKAAKLDAPISLRLKGDVDHAETVAYDHKSRSTSFEDANVRHQEDEKLHFVSKAQTLKVDAAKDSFTQALTIVSKEGEGNLHDFAMPEKGETLEVTSDAKGNILRAGDYSPSSIFYVPPVSLPPGPVNIGDTWAMRANWLSRDEMVPYTLNMASILKQVWECGAHKCAEIEISGEVTLDGAITKTMAFKSLWKGFLMFDIDVGTVIWSRVDSEEQFMSGNVRRAINSCLEASLLEPADIRLKKTAGKDEEPCKTLSKPGDIAPRP